MRVIALDFGSARCGVAVCDPTELLVTPLEPVLSPGTRRGLGRVVEVVREREAGRVLVGLPLRLSGEDSDQTREVRAWAERLAERVRVPVELYDERFTTRIAARTGGSASEDSRAAAVLLEDWLASRGSVA